MNAQIVSEFRKVRTTWAAWGLLGVMSALVALGVFGIVKGTSAAALVAALHQQSFLAVPVLVVSVMTLVLGLRSFTDEFRHGSIVPTLLADPDRTRVLVAKLVATGVVACAMTLAITGLAFAIGVPMLAVKGVAIVVSPAPLAVLVAKIVLVGIMWSAIGVGIGLAVRHQVPAIVGSLVWLLVGQYLVAALVPNIARFLPGQASDAITAVSAGAGGAAPNMLAPAAAVLVFAGWLVVAVVSGGVLMARRDIA